MKGYKTLIFNGAVALVPIVDYAVNNGDMVAQVLGNHGPAVLSLLGLVNIVLRWITSTPVLKSE